MTDDTAVVLAEFLRSLTKPMPVIRCNFIGNCFASAESYKSQRMHQTPVEIATYALTQLDAAWTKVQECHAANNTALLNNERMRNILTAVMTEAGIQRDFDTYEYPNSRSRNRKRVHHISGYLSDLNRTFVIDDGFDEEQRRYIRLKEDYERYHAQVVALDAKMKAEKEQEAERYSQKRKDDLALARLLIRYELSDDSEWPDILDALTDKNKYIDLAVACYSARCNWSDGFDYVKSALDRFVVVDDRDKDIAADLSECLDHTEDGRIFRDTKWCYDALFSIVDDRQLVDDVRICLEHICFS